jgi:hypothetical protein
MLARGLAGLLMSTLIRLAKAEAFGRPGNIHCAWKGRGPGAAARVPTPSVRAPHPRAVHRSLLPPANPLREHGRAEAAPAQVDRGRECGDQGGWICSKVPIADVHRASPKPPQSADTGRSLRSSRNSRSCPGPCFACRHNGGSGSRLLSAPLSVLTLRLPDRWTV